jgi:hypothetical protein
MRWESGTHHALLREPKKSHYKQDYQYAETIFEVLLKNE